MIRPFSVSYSARTLVLLLCEAVVVSGSFLLAAAHLAGPHPDAVLFYDNGLLKIAGITALTLLLFYYFDLYEPQRISERWETYLRLMLVVSLLFILLAALFYFFPAINLGWHVLLLGISILAVSLLVWRSIYKSVIGHAAFHECVYVLGSGERARAVIESLRARSDAGIQVVEGESQCTLNEDSERFASDLRIFRDKKTRIDRIILAMEDRRESMPVAELLELRLRGVAIEDSSFVMERLMGRLPLDGLNPKNIIFTEGFNLKASNQFAERFISILASLIGMTVFLPLLPFLALAIRLSSPGPALIRQTRVGLHGRPFSMLKFRTMRLHAEPDTAIWTEKNDPRVTPLGGFLRKAHFDEIPQFWNVLRGEMGIVGPRPERPEFVQWLAKEIPFYELRHIVRPGITGWAQIRYQYGASLEETKRKLEYDLYYIKHLSIGLYLLILFETIKTSLLGRGSQ
jgi:sugar transferase (PEP-CTERM system associated)